MKSARFTIAGMLATIGGLGVGFAALTHPNDWAASALLTMTFGMLLLSLLVAVGNHDIRRAFWMGFALFGWSHGLVTLNVGLGGSVSQDLITTRAIERLRPILHPTQTAFAPMIMNGNGPVPSSGFSPPSPYAWAFNGTQTGINTWPVICPSCGLITAGTSVDAFSRIGQAVATVIVALFGGITGTTVFRRARRHERRTQESTSSEIALNEPLRSA